MDSSSTEDTGYCFNTWWCCSRYENVNQWIICWIKWIFSYNGVTIWSWYISRDDVNWHTFSLFTRCRICFISSVSHTLCWLDRNSNDILWHRYQPSEEISIQPEDNVDGSSDYHQLPNSNETYPTARSASIAKYCITFLSKNDWEYFKIDP